MTKEDKMREALKFICILTDHDGKAGNEYRYPSIMAINYKAKEALNYEPGDAKS